MKNELLRAAILLSLTGAILTFVVLLLRPLASRHFSAKWQRAMCTLALAAFVLPVWLVPQYFVRHAPEGVTPYAPLPTQAVQMSSDTLQGVVDLPAQGSVPPITVKNAPIVDLETALCALWALGALLALARLLTAYALWLRCVRRTREAFPCTCLEDCMQQAGVRHAITIWRTPLANSPMLVGLLRPMILLPPGDIAEEALRAALLHELTHLRAHDLPRKWLAALATCLHWMNPAAHLAQRMLHQSCETACDLTVTQMLPAAARENYMRAVLSFAAHSAKGQALATSMSAGRRELERRFSMITKQTPIRRLARRISAALTACLLFIALMVSSLAANAIVTLAESDITNQVSGGKRMTIYVEGSNAYFVDASDTVVDPISYQDTTYIPLRTAGEWMGKNVRWDAQTQTIYLEGTTDRLFRDIENVNAIGKFGSFSTDNTAKLVPQRTLVVDGERKHFYTEKGDEVFPIDLRGTTYLPLRALGMLSGFEVAYCATPSTIYLRTPMTSEQSAATKVYVDMLKMQGKIINDLERELLTTPDPTDAARIAASAEKMKQATQTMLKTPAPTVPLLQNSKNLQQLLIYVKCADETLDALLAAIARDEAPADYQPQYIGYTINFDRPLEDNGAPVGLGILYQIITPFSARMAELYYQNGQF